MRRWQSAQNVCSWWQLLQRGLSCLAACGCIESQSFGWTLRGRTFPSWQSVQYLEVWQLPQKALSYATTLAALPRRLDELVTRIDRGEVAVQTPQVDRRLRSLERAAGRLVSAIVFAGLLFAGVFLLPTVPWLGWTLMGASVVPLVHVLVTWRSR